MPIQFPEGDTPRADDRAERSLIKINSLLFADSQAPANSLGIPGHNYVALTYFGATNNAQTVTFKTGGAAGTTVAVLTLTYVGGGAADDDKIATVTRS